MDVEEIVKKYSNMLYKICIVMLCNEQDVQDAIQETFCRLMERGSGFESKEHEKAWLIHVATNICRDMLRFRMRHPQVSMTSVASVESLSERLVTPQYRETLTELLELPVKLRTVIYLHYVEGYQVKEIAAMLDITQQAVKKRLQRGREQLRLVYQEG